MILFYGEGRLGNQVFQYQALCAMAKDRETIVAAGLENLPEFFEISRSRLRILTRDKSIKRAIKYVLIPFIVRPAARALRLLNYAFEPMVQIDGRAEPGGDITLKRGLLRCLTFVDGGHYQNPSLWPAVFSAATLPLRASVRNAARSLLTTIQSAPEPLSFVHVRRGDYLNYKPYGVSELCLPIEFYRAAIVELRRRVGKTHLLFITDDPQWVNEQLGDIPHKTVLSNDALMDFAIMTECKNGIISNSTFSLAAALVMPDPGIVIAPEYWFGFRMRTWYPPQIRCIHQKLLYLRVQASS